MAALTVTSAAIMGVEDVASSKLVSAEAIDPGEFVYRDANGQAALAEKASTSTEATLLGIALNGADGADQPINVATAGLIRIRTDATIGEGNVYRVSSTPGGAEDIGDAISSGEYMVVVGVSEYIESGTETALRLLIGTPVAVT